MLQEMPSLELLIKKYGETRGRKKYNRFHRDYRKRNPAKILAIKQRSLLKARALQATS